MTKLHLYCFCLPFLMHVCIVYHRESFIKLPIYSNNWLTWYSNDRLMVNVLFFYVFQISPIWVWRMWTQYPRQIVTRWPLSQLLHPGTLNTRTAVTTYPRTWVMSPRTTTQARTRRVLWVVLWMVLIVALVGSQEGVASPEGLVTTVQGPCTVDLEVNSQRMLLFSFFYLHGLFHLNTHIKLCERHIEIWITV